VCRRISTPKMLPNESDQLRIGQLYAPPAVSFAAKIHSPSVPDVSSTKHARYCRYLQISSHRRTPRHRNPSHQRPPARRRSLTSSPNVSKAAVLPISMQAQELWELRPSHAVQSLSSSPRMRLRPLPPSVLISPRLASARTSTVEPGGTSTALKQAIRRNISFDIVFLDPPYEADAEYTRTLLTLGGEAHTSLLAPDAVVIAEHSRKQSFLPRYGDLEHYRTHKQGDAALSFYRIARAEST